MSHELQCLDIPHISRISPDLPYWLPRVQDTDLCNHEITKIIIGSTTDGHAYYPVEIDLAKKQPKTIFVVGNEDSRKDALIVGLLRRAVGTIDPRYLVIDILSNHNDSAKLMDLGFVEKGLRTANWSKAPDGPVTAKMLDRISKEIETQTKSESPHIFIIDDLGFALSALSKTPGGGIKQISTLKKIFEYSDRLPILTIATINPEYMDSLKSAGISPEDIDATWLFGRLGAFSVLNRKTNELSKTAIMPFVI